MNQNQYSPQGYYPQQTGGFPPQQGYYPPPQQTGGFPPQQGYAPLPQNAPQYGTAPSQGVNYQQPPQTAPQGNYAPQSGYNKQGNDPWVGVFGGVAYNAEKKYANVKGNQTAITEFTICQNDISGKTTFWKISVWGEAEATAAAFIEKGDRVAAQGYAKARQYTTKDGNQGISHEIVAKWENILLSKKQWIEQQTGRQHQQPAPPPNQTGYEYAQAPPTAPDFVPVDDEEDVPF
jgi:single-stranded DNA-binding protein